MRAIEPFIWILWDLIAVGIFFRCAYQCANRGFVSTVTGLLIYVVAIIAAHAIYLNVADFLYENVVHDAVQHVLTRNFSEMLSAVGGSQNDIVQAIPFSLRILLGFKRGEVEDMQSDNANELADRIIEAALEKPLMSILHTVGFLLVFALAAFFMRKLSRFFTGINKVPVIGTVNTVLGAIAGVIEGFLSLIVSGFALRLLITSSGEAWWWLNTGVIESTYIWRLFY